MTDTFLKDLNKEQQQAVTATQGPTIILAGAGSGKTRVITYKVHYLINQGIDPFNILTVTFTNKAASEMKERIQRFLKRHNMHVSSMPLMTTFHALCAKILRIDGKHIGISPRFVIYDTQDQLDAVKEAMRQLDISIKNYKPGSILGTISQAKNELITADEYQRLARGPFQQVVALVYKKYQSILKDNDAVDFDDLLLKTVKLFQFTPDILAKYQERFRYILIDEYQDTNHAQYTLTRQLAEKWKNICVVGDFSQSIYSWRGADFRNLEKFKTDFPSAQSFSLSQNYRSTQKILDAASTVISRNTTHPILQLWTQNPEGEDIMLYNARDEHNEAEFIVDTILSYKLKDPNFSYNDVAVLYRTNAQSRVIEEVLLHKSIPYMLVGGTRFYERKEIKDIIAYLRIIANPKDMISYKRIEKLGKGRLQQFLTLQETLDSENQPTLEILDAILQRTDYLSLYDEHDEDDRQRLENIKELRSVAIAFSDLTIFLENVALIEQEHMPDYVKNSNEPVDKITLLTLHAAKGLEYPIVFMVGMEEGLFPHSRSLMDKHELEEERRLCYVGITRAKKKLFFTYSRKRLFFGQRSSNTISRFLLELPERVVSQNLRSIPIDITDEIDYL